VLAIDGFCLLCSAGFQKLCSENVPYWNKPGGRFVVCNTVFHLGGVSQKRKRVFGVVFGCCYLGLEIRACERKHLSRDWYRRHNPLVFRMRLFQLRERLLSLKHFARRCKRQATRVQIPAH
jgi:hypothetical protein